MKVYTYPEEKELLVKKLERRKQLYDRSLIQTVADIFNQVAKSGDKAILDLTKNSTIPV